ncbi:MAG: hypothetical protein IEMM0008_1923 [bacterium]|nr:MAG: hypothetical protein IEMM0008_1923 [bacterium]
MKRHPLNIYCLLWTLALLFNVLPLHAEDSDQTKKKATSSSAGKGFIALNAYYFSAKKRHIKNGDNQEIGRFTELTFQLYTDYWFTDALNVFLSFTFLKHATATSDSSTSFSPSADTSVADIGDLDLGFKYKWFDQPGIKSYAGLVFGLPTGNSDAGSGLTLGGQSFTIPTGNGDFNIILFNQWGFNLLDRLTLGLEIAYNFRSEDNSDEYSLAAYPGVKVLNYKLHLELGLRWLNSVGNGNRVSNSLARTHANETEFLVLNPKATLYLGPISLTAGAFLGLVAKNTPAITVFQLGAGYQY